MSDIQCSTCGATIALADAEESVVSAAVKNHDRFCRQQHPTTPRGNTMSTPALHAVDDGKRPHPKKLVDHPDKRIAAAAKKVMDAIDRLDQVWAENAAKAELRAERDRLKAQLKKVESQLRGGAPAAAPARDWKAIRAWATGSGLDCPATGKVPNAIIDAYDQAHA